MAADSSPPVCVQILAVIILLCFGVYSFIKGASSSSFSWWSILGAACLLATAFAAFRLYEVCRRKAEETKKRQDKDEHRGLSEEK